MKNATLIILANLFLFAAPGNIQAVAITKIELLNGGIVKCMFLERMPDEIRCQTEDYDLAIKKSEIKRLVPPQPQKHVSLVNKYKNTYKPSSSPDSSSYQQTSSRGRGESVSKRVSRVHNAVFDKKSKDRTQNSSFEKRVALEIKNLEADKLKSTRKCELSSSDVYACYKPDHDRIDKKLELLKSDPEYYFELKLARIKSREEKRKNKPSTIINSFTGEVLTRSGDGYVGTRDGTYYMDAAGGVIDTRTGEFLPVN